MKLTTAASRIRGLHLGEVALNLIRQDQVPIKAKYALLTEDGETCGYFEKAEGWSEETVEALQKLVACMENDALKLVFKIDDNAPAESAATDEPPQF